MTDHVEYAAAIAEGVRQGMSGFRGVVELEDCQQEGLLAFYAIEWPEECEEPERLVSIQVRGAVRRFCEAERADRFGYEVADLHRYSAQWVRVLLPDALAYELTGDLPQAPNETRVSGGGDASDGKGTLVSLIDVLTGVAELSDRDREILTMVFFHQWSDERVAEALGVVESSVPTTVARAVGRVCSRLNDRRRAADSEHEGPGSRRAITSGHGQALTGNTMDSASGHHLRPRRALRRVPAHDQPELQ